jgi:hypothetical protein
MMTQPIDSGASIAIEWPPFEGARSALENACSPADTVAMLIRRKVAVRAGVTDTRFYNGLYTFRTQDVQHQRCPASPRRHHRRAARTQD